jgi:hypothetical protein
MEQGRRQTSWYQFVAHAELLVENSNVCLTQLIRECRNGACGEYPQSPWELQRDSSADSPRHPCSVFGGTSESAATQAAPTTARFTVLSVQFMRIE